MRIFVLLNPWVPKNLNQEKQRRGRQRTLRVRVLLGKRFHIAIVRALGGPALGLDLVINICDEATIAELR